MTYISSLFIATCLFSSVFLSVSAEEELRGVVVLHRHGARTTMGVVNGELVCSGQEYCQLTDEGKSMCRSLGRVMSQYRTSLHAPPRYNVSFMMSNSTNYARVVISAEAMVMGMYEDLLNSTEPPLPFVDFVPIDQDIAMVQWHSWPSWQLRDTYHVASQGMNAKAVAAFGQTHLDQLGAYLGIQQICANSPMDCIGYVQDAICCNISSGAPVPAWILNNHEQYRVVVSQFLFELLGYNMTNDFNQQIGSLGYPWAQDALYALNRMARDDYDGVRVQHAAAHDWTLLAVYSALGMYSAADSGNTTFVPRFAEALVLEVWKVNGVAMVRPKWGYPSQAPGTHDYTFKVANVTCVNATSTYYAADTVQGECALKDLQAFVETTAPLAQSGGVCYATDDMLQSSGCDADSAPPVDSACYFFRQTCPAAPCGTKDGAIADPARGYVCQSLDFDTPSDDEYLGATIVALIAPSLLAGAIGGFYFGQRLKQLLWSKGAQDGEAGVSGGNNENGGGGAAYSDVDQVSERTPIVR